MPQLSIIIVTYNSENLIGPCLKSIIKAAVDLDFEIIIIDNNSQDKTLSSIESICQRNSKLNERIRLIKNRKNIGFAGGVNYGIKLSKGKFVLLLNPDMRVLDKAITVGLEFLKTNSSIGIVGGKFLEPKTLKVQPSFGRFPSLFTEFLHAFGLYKIFPYGRFVSKNIFSSWKFKARFVDWVSGGFMLLRREVLERVGLFDENFFMYLEDIDFCYRAKQAGYKIYYFPQISVLHHHMASSKNNLFRPVIYEIKSLLYYFRKHKKNNLWVLKFLIWLRIHLRILGYFWGSLFDVKYKKWYEAYKKVKNEIYPR